MFITFTKDEYTKWEYRVILTNTNTARIVSYGSSGTIISWLSYSNLRLHIQTYENIK